MSSFASDNKDEYSRDRFYTHSTDRQGHKSTVRADVPPGLLAQIGDLIASKAIPEYRRPGDFVRDAIFHRAHEIAERIQNDEFRKSVRIETALDVARAYEIAEENEVRLAHAFDERLRENRHAYSRAYVQSYMDAAETVRGREEIMRVHNRYF